MELKYFNTDPVHLVALIPDELSSTQYLQVNNDISSKWFYLKD